MFIQTMFKNRPANLQKVRDHFPHFKSLNHHLQMHIQRAHQNLAMVLKPMHKRLSSQTKIHQTLQRHQNQFMRRVITEQLDQTHSDIHHDLSLLRRTTNSIKHVINWVHETVAIRNPPNTVRNLVHVSVVP